MKPVDEFFGRADSSRRSQRCRSCVSDAQRLDRESPVGRAKALLGNAIRNSKRRGHSAPTLSPEDLLPALTRGTCAVTGLKFDFKVNADGRHNPLAPSLDRPDSTRPYTRSNFRLVCWAVNMGCGEWGLKTYLQIAAAALGVQGPT